jgi:hypothetical protein
MEWANLFEHRRDAVFSQTLSMWFGTVVPVVLNEFQLMQGTPSLASNAWSGIDECIKLGDGVAVHIPQDERGRAAVRVDDEVVFATEFVPVRGIRAGLFPRTPRESTNCPQALVTSRFCYDDAVRPATFRGCFARFLLRGMRRVFTSRSRPNGIPSLAVADSTQCQSATRTRCPSSRHKPGSWLAARILAGAWCPSRQKWFDEQPQFVVDEFFRHRFLLDKTRRGS